MTLQNQGISQRTTSKTFQRDWYLDIAGGEQPLPLKIVFLNIKFYENGLSPPILYSEDWENNIWPPINLRLALIWLQLLANNSKRLREIRLIGVWMNGVFLLTDEFYLTRHLSDPHARVFRRPGESYNRNCISMHSCKSY